MYRIPLFRDYEEVQAFSCNLVCFYGKNLFFLKIGGHFSCSEVQESPWLISGCHGVDWLCYSLVYGPSILQRAIYELYFDNFNRNPSSLTASIRLSMWHRWSSKFLENTRIFSSMQFMEKSWSPWRRIILVRIHWKMDGEILRPKGNLFHW